MNPLAVQLQTLLTSVLQSNEAQSCDSILLSGGLDTSIAAEIIKGQRESRLSTGITVTIDPDSNQLAAKRNLFVKQPQDVEYATRIANKLDIRLHILTPTLDELVSGPAMDLCTKTLRTFEPMELRNAMVISHALLYAKSLGLSRVCTGDGADELFAGYKFMHQMDKNKLVAYIREMAKTMRFCAIPLATHLGISVWSPYLDSRVIEFATSGIPASLLVGEFAGAVHGKLLLRQAFPWVVAAARKKEPIECGSGTVVMPMLAEHLIADDVFAERAREIKTRFDIVVSDKEQMLYFPSFQQMVLQDPQIIKAMVAQGKVVFKRPIGREAMAHLGRVIGGTDAGSGSYPFAAFLMVDEGDSTAFCGGSIISPEWILTAGHCVVDTSGGNKLHINGTESPFQLTQKLQTKWPANWGKSQRQFKTVGPKDIVVGVGSIYNVQTEPQKVSKVVVHPDLNLDYFDNDIALLKLKHKLKFNPQVQPIHIDTDVVSDGLTVTGVGWGKTSLESQTTANVLQQVDLKTGDEGLCRRIRPEFDDNDGNYICVTTPDGRDTCSGDSGGPLLRRCNGDPRLTGALGNGPWVLLGITSYGDSVASSSETVCAAQDGAGFYTHAAKYLGFISDTTGIKRENLAASCNGSKINYVGNINAAEHIRIVGAIQIGVLLVAIFQFL
ncbi:hypothetical protein EV183_005199 [Coemansia sp. RSA 2336]|nr:hypothetical protein EV183_005199 [Coemansia sp. RSA 2336]